MPNLYSTFTSHVQSLPHLYHYCPCPVRIPLLLPIVNHDNSLYSPCLISVPFLLPMSNLYPMSIILVQTVHICTAHVQTVNISAAHVRTESQLYHSRPCLRLNLTCVYPLCYLTLIHCSSVLPIFETFCGFCDNLNFDLPI